MNLSKTQTTILQRLADGERLIQVSPIELYSWEAKMSTGPRWQSVNKLIKARFVTSAKCDWYRALVITDARHDYLKGISTDLYKERTP